MRKLTETEIPPLSPKLSKRCGAEWGGHDGFCFDTKALPQQSDDLERAEVKQQDDS